MHLLRSTVLWRARWVSRLVFASLLSLLIFDLVMTQAVIAASAPPKLQQQTETRIIKNVRYTTPAAGSAGNRQSLDLYLPRAAKAPLVIFIHGGFWTLTDDDYQIGSLLADALVPSGVAVALVRYRLAPAYQHPAQAEDVAAAVTYLIRQASKYGYDTRRVFLAGHSAGAHLAALIVLDPRYLAEHDLSPKALAGVIALSGIYDLTDQAHVTRERLKAIEQAFGDDPQTLKSASPVTHVRSDAPSFLILSASSDLRGFPIEARRFAAALRAADHTRVQQHMIPDRDHFSIVQLAGQDNQVSAFVLAFLNVQPLPPALAELMDAKRKWQSVPVTTEPFWRHRELIRSYPIDRRFVERLLPIYGPLRHELLEWPLENYHAIDLFAYLNSLPPEQVGKGDYLVITNLRGQKQFWPRQKIEPYKPVIVVGIDEEKNLFRFATFYRMLRQYSWKPGPQPPVMARPAGAFIHFLEKPPPILQSQEGHYALTHDSFRLVEEDPLAVFTDLPKEVYETLSVRNGCVYCHSFRGVGARSHHNLAATGAAAGGFALPLESYPAEVWKSFIFNQHEVAEKLGATPNVVSENARQALYDGIIESRKQQQKSKR